MKTRFFAIVVVAMFAIVANAQVEFDRDMQVAKTNYGYIKKQNQPHQDIVQVYVGNDTEPTIIYSEDNHGWGIDAFGQFGTFAGNPTFGGGVGIGYRGRNWGSDVHIGFRRAQEDDASDRKASFNQGQVGLRLHYNIIQWNNHHDVISLFGEVSFQLSSFLDEDSKTWTTQETDGQGTTTTTTTTAQNLDVRQFTIGFKGGAEFEHKFKFSPFSLILGGGFGRQQNIILSTNKWYNQGEVYAGVRIRINQHKKYNDRALQELGMSRSDVWAK